MRVLIVEDEPTLGAQLRDTFVAAGFVAELTGDGEEAQYLGEVENYDAVVLDLGLPNVDGLSVLTRWREGGRKMPVLILTARARWPEKLAGFNAGADDYLTKPFEMQEVIVRIRALIRRSAGHAETTLSCGPLTLDTTSGNVTVNGLPLHLTAQEFRILAYLMHHSGKVISRSELIEHVYDRDSDRDSNVIDVLVGRIRKKMSVNVIHTVRGLGYRLAQPEA
jgi:two-component system OmpR family response regulator